MNILTKTQINLLSNVEEFLKSIVGESGEALMLSLHSGWKRIDVAFFDVNEGQHSFVPGQNFQEKIDAVLAIKAGAKANAAQAKENEIKSLRERLERLTGDAA